MQEKENKYYRYSPPIKYDQLPYKTIVVVMNSATECCDYFIQMSHDQNNPLWKKIEDVGSNTAL